MDVSPTEQREWERQLQASDRLSRELAQIGEQPDIRLQVMRITTGIQELARRRREPAVAGRQFLVYTAAEVLESVPAKMYEEEGKEEEMCAICLSNFKEKGMYRVLPKCKHRFHQECMDKWLMKRASYPVCMAEVDLDML